MNFNPKTHSWPHRNIIIIQLSEFGHPINIFFEVPVVIVENTSDKPKWFACVGRTSRPYDSPTQSGWASRYVKCLFTGITYAFCLAHNFCLLAVVAEMMMANGSTTSILQAISNLLIVIKWFVKLTGFSRLCRTRKLNVA